MARSRALLTERQREHIANQTGEDGEYETVSRLRARMRDELVEDVAVLAEHRPEVLAELREIVCEE
jgi:hypothetical protein